MFISAPLGALPLRKIRDEENMGKTRENNNEAHQKVENSTTDHIREPSHTDSCDLHYFFVLLVV